jgi:hypothetical protein
MDVLDQLHLAHWADASERLRLVNLAADEIERLRHEFRELHADISMFMKDGPLKQDLLEDIMDVLGEGDDEKRTLD